MDHERQLRAHVVGLLRGGNAHIDIAAAVADFPEALIVADHNAYYSGELAILRQVELGWGPDHTAWTWGNRDQWVTRTAATSSSRPISGSCVTLRHHGPPAGRLNSIPVSETCSAGLG